MPTHHSNESPEAPRRRADAERSVARILEAAIDCLSTNPDVSMAEIAREAGVVRATIYVHFPTREALMDAVTHHALAEVAQVIATSNPDSGDALDALRRVVAAAWKTLGRYHGLVAVNVQRPHEELHHEHGSVLSALEPLIARGQSDGVFRSDVPTSWHLATLLALVHSASGELRGGRITESSVETALIATVVGALSAGHSQ